MSGCDDCYWYNEGNCFLEQDTKGMPIEWIEGIVRRSPKARQDINKCANECDKCDKSKIPDVIFDFVDDPPVKSRKERSDDFMSSVNNYHHRPWY